MTRCYADLVEVVRCDDEPAQFLWRSRLHIVRAVLAHWVESTAWWRGAAAAALQTGAAPGSVSRALTCGTAPGSTSRPTTFASYGSLEDSEREVWRVEATAGRDQPIGVFDLTRLLDDGRWYLVRVHD